MENAMDNFKKCRMEMEITNWPKEIFTEKNLDGSKLYPEDKDDEYWLR